MPNGIVFDDSNSTTGSVINVDVSVVNVFTLSKFMISIIGWRGCSMNDSPYLRERARERENSVGCPHWKTGAWALACLLINCVHLYLLFSCSLVPIV